MAIYGHDAILYTLRSSNPKVSFFHGPTSIGKWTTAEWLRAYRRIEPLDTLRVHSLTAATARAVTQFASLAPVGPNGRLAIIRLDGASEASQNILLKSLEDSPSFIRFVLIGENYPIETVRSRASTFEFSSLSVEDLTRILVEKRGVSEKAAPGMAVAGHGTVKRALESLATSDSKATVLKALRAISARDEFALELLAPHWDDLCTNLLQTWCIERRSGQWKIFSPEDDLLGDARVAMQILLALRSDLRPKLVVRAALVLVLRGQ